MSSPMAVLKRFTPIQGEFSAFMVGLACGSVFHEDRFGLKWEREQIMIPLQKCLDKIRGIPEAMHLLGMFADEFLVPYFALLYWLLDKYKCVYGIWLVPISEIFNGCMKWYYNIPRPGWVDANVRLRSWNHEFSFPSSHSQIIWSLATFFVGTSAGSMRAKLFGGWRNQTAAKWWFFFMPYVFAGLVSLSRVFEGVHYPRDITVGAGVGVGLASVYMRVLPMLKAWVKTKPAVVRWALMQGFAIFVYSVMRLYHRYTRRPSDEADIEQWRQTALKAYRSKKDLPLEPITEPFRGYTAMTGVMSGLALGETIMPNIPLAYPSNATNAVARAVLGLSTLMGIFLGLETVQKKIVTDDKSKEMIRFARYGSVPVVILVVAPTLFNKLRI